MFKINKIISTITLLCFLSSTAVSDLAFGQILNYRSNVDNLAAPSGLDDIVGIQHKDMGRIEIALEEQLVALIRSGLAVNIGTFQTILKEQSFKEKTIFQPANMQFFFRETKLTDAGLCVMVRLWDKYGLRTYYATFSLQKDGKGGFPIKVYTGKQYIGTARFTKGVPQAKAEDAKAIERYIQHKKGIDAVIRYAHEKGLAREPISERFDYSRYVERILNENGIKVTNPEKLIPIDARKFFLVKLTIEVRNMILANPAVIIDAEGKEHMLPYYAHSSNNAMYVFIKGEAFESLTNPEYVVAEPGRDTTYQLALAEVENELNYEIGVPLGFRVTVDRTVRLWNELSRRSAAGDSERKKFRANPLEVAIVNLDHVKYRDYAAAEVKREEGSAPKTIETASPPASILEQMKITPQKKVRVGINGGAGRIGTTTIRAWLRDPTKQVEVVAINDAAFNFSSKEMTPEQQLEKFADFLYHDTVHHQLASDIQRKDIKVGREEKDGETHYYIDIKGKRIYVSDIKDPAQLPWKKHDVDVAIEATGRFLDKESASKHLQAGAGRVIISAPPQGKGVPTFVMGVNHQKFDKAYTVISNASCTTNCLAPIAALLHKAFQVKDGEMDTIHAVTNDQATVDMFRPSAPMRGKAAFGNILPTSTGAATAIGAVIPELEGKLKGIAVRVPVLDGSLLILKVRLEKPTTKEEVNRLFKEAADKGGALEGILAYQDEPIASTSIIGRPESAIVIGGLTNVSSDGKSITVRAWYDNEFGYSTRLLDLAQFTQSKLAGSPAQEKRIYFFGADQTEGDGSMKESLGGKGAGLAKMAKLDLPVPPGFTITTNETRAYLKDGKNKMPDGLQEEIDAYLTRLETVSGKKLGDRKDPLLVSVRSGASASMPGMMDTVLNLGLNDQTVEGLAIRTDNTRFAYDSYRRFINMFGSAVFGIPKDKFNGIMDAKKRERGFTEDTQLDENDMKSLVEEYKKLVKDVTGEEFPQDPRTQLRLAVEAVFKSSNTERAIIYRRINRIPQDTVSAVNVVLMVFGNTGENSGTGVAFSRDTSTGERRFNGEFLINAQGEDVVAGLRKGMPIGQLKDRMSDVYDQLVEIVDRLEKIDKDVQDVEFTIEDGKLWMLQQRRAKRTALAMLRTAVEMADEGLISKEEAILRVEGQRFEELMHPMVDSEAAKKFTKLAKGTAASPGAAVGRAVFSSNEAQTWAKRGERVILVRKETSPEDLGGMVASQGILTSLGGTTSHAALVARAQGIPAVVGVGDLSIDYEAKLFRAGGHVIKEGDWITEDGTTGNVYGGEVPTIASEIEQVETGVLKAEDSKVYQMYQRLLQWADKIRQTQVWANADTPQEAKRARKLGAQGIGLTRTEHMFRDIKGKDGKIVEERLLAVQTMFLAKEGSSERNAILEEIEGMQRRDFEGILEAMEGLPVTIRLLDPPIHEFLPNPDDDKTVNIIAERLHVTPDEIRQRIRSTHEINPMLGTRGVRVQILHPSTLKMQTRAMVQAYANLVKRGIHAKLKIMVPNVSLVEEFMEVKPVIQGIIKEILDREGISGNDRRIAIGTMIEMPSAALAAEEIAREADFFSFGTNDLTQFSLGMSRDDAARSFLPIYIGKGIFKYDPTQVLHPKVLRLVQLAVQEGRKVKPDLDIGVCGEHGGEPNSIISFIDAGLDYVSASPLRVPVARLASAQAALKKRAATMTPAVTVPAPAPAENNRTLRRIVREVSSEEEIAAMDNLAKEAGLEIPTHPSQHYTLLLTSEFFGNGELEEHKAKYGDRFDLDRISGKSPEQFVDNILAKAAGKEARTIALVPNDLAAEQLERLTKVGIRFVRVNTTDLQKARADRDANREKFQVDTYAMMLLLRRIDNSITADSSIYRLLSFYLKSHFALTDKIAIDDYIMAIVNNDIARLIKGYLTYRPAQPYEAPNYNNVAASLISA